MHVYKALVLAGIALVCEAVSAEDLPPIADTIASIEQQLNDEEAELSPGRLDPPWTEPDTGARIISDQFPTTFGALMELPSPAGETFLTLVGDDLALRRTGSEERVRLTTDGEPKRTWRATDEAAQAFPAAWSPDGRFLAAMRLNLRDVRHEPVMRYLETPPRVDRYPYPRAGEDMPRYEPHIIDLESGTRTAIRLGDTSDHYVTIEGWLGDGSALILQVLDRQHKHLRLYKVVPSGEARLWFEDRTETYFDSWMTLFEPLIYPLQRSSRALHLSDRSGTRTIYMVSATGALRPLSVGSGPVQRIVTIDEARGHVFYLASPDPQRPYDLSLFRSPLESGGAEELQSCAGFLTAQASASQDRFFTRCSSIEQPPVYRLVNASGTVIRTSAPLAANRFIGRVESFQTRSTDGRWAMHGAILKPANFDPARRYPVVEVIYGGMQWDFFPREFYGFGILRDGYNGYLARILSEHGFVVVMMSAPGTPGRSKAFQDAVYGRWPQGVIANHARFIREAAADRPWMDLSRVGVFGNSWGGYMAQRAMIDAPDLYKTAIAMSPPSDFVDHPTYIEPFMGLPSANPEGYAAGSNLVRVGEIRGSVMVMPMPLDVNSGFSPAMKFVDAMIKQRRDVTLFTLPEVNHRLNCCGTAREYYAYAKVLRFFQAGLSDAR